MREEEREREGEKERGRERERKREREVHVRVREYCTFLIIADYVSSLFNTNTVEEGKSDK